MTGFCGISFVSQSRQTIGDHYFWVDSLSLKSKLAKKFYDGSLRIMLYLSIPAKLLAAFVFEIFAFFKNKRAKKLTDFCCLLPFLCMGGALVFHEFTSRSKKSI